MRPWLGIPRGRGEKSWRRRPPSSRSTVRAALRLTGSRPGRASTRSAYTYFGNKRALFERVLIAEVGAIADSMAFDPGHEDPVGDYAGRVFDYHQDRPELIRLLLREGLTLPGGVPDEPNRVEYYASKVARFANAQESGVLTPEVDPGTLVFEIMALITWWEAAPHIARMLSPAASDLEARRAAVVTAAPMTRRTERLGSVSMAVRASDTC